MMLSKYMEQIVTMHEDPSISNSVGLKLVSVMPDQVDAERNARLYGDEKNSYGGMQGFIQVHDADNDTWSFVNISDWNFSDATVACRELGMPHCKKNPCQ